MIDVRNDQGHVELASAAAASRPPDSQPTFSTKLVQIAATTIGIALFWITREVWVLVFGGILLGVFLNGLALFVSRHLQLSRAWSLAITLIALTALVLVSGWFLGL